MSVLSRVSRRSSRLSADRFSRSRWAAVGAAVAVVAAGLLPASASLDTGERPVFVPITPCRLVDTRPAPETVGPRAMPVGADESYAAQVRGKNGKCTIPADAVGVVMNVAAIAPTAGSFLTVYPSDGSRPLAANLNWIAGQPPVSNAVTADLSADGKVSFYNLAGTVDIAADIVGYFIDHNHDDRYYTKAQSDAAVAGAVDPAELANAVAGFYTKAQVDAAVAAAADPTELAAAIATAVDPTELATAIAGKVDKPTGPQTLQLDPTAFLPTTSGELADYSSPALRGGDASQFTVAAPVQLPQGAVVTGISLRVHDNDNAGGASLNGSLVRNALGGGDAYEVMAITPDTVGQALAVTLTDNTIAFATIDNATFTYVFRVSSISNTLTFYSATITYTIP